MFFQLQQLTEGFEGRPSHHSCHISSVVFVTRDETHLYTWCDCVHGQVDRVNVSTYIYSVTNSNLIGLVTVKIL